SGSNRSDRFPQLLIPGSRGIASTPARLKCGTSGSLTSSATPRTYPFRPSRRKFANQHLTRFGLSRTLFFHCFGTSISRESRIELCSADWERHGRRAGGENGMGEI